MSDQGYYIGFAGSEEISALGDELIEKNQAEKKRRHDRRLAEMLNQFTDEAIDTYLLNIVATVGIQGSKRKVVDFTAKTLKKTANVTTKRLVKGLDVKQQADFISYIETVRLKQANADGQEATYIICPVSESFFQQIRDGHQQYKDQSNRAVPVLKKNLQEVIDWALRFYVDEPLKILKLGPILSKVVNVAIDTSVKLVNSVIDKVFMKLDEEEMLRFIDYFENLMIEGPIHESMKDT